MCSIVKLRLQKIILNHEPGKFVTNVNQTMATDWSYIVSEHIFCYKTVEVWWC